MTLLIAFASLSIFVSFICSILEAALLSITPSFIAKQKVTNAALYEKLKKLKDKIDQPLAAILTLNTVAHTVGATGVGAQVAIIWSDAYLGAASAVMTLLILIFSEILPKTIGAKYWINIAPYLPTVLNGLILILKPFIFMSDLIMKLFGNHNYDHDIRTEIKALTILGRELNELDINEQRVISNILDLHDIKIKDIMTPRIVCKTGRPDENLKDFLLKIKKEPFSRYPIIDSQESPLGMVLRYDMLDTNLDQKVEDIMKPVKTITSAVNVEQLLSQFIQEQQHMSLVYDEYGSWQGIVTMEDIIETILGKSIMDETDDIPNMRRFARKRWENKMKRPH